MSTTQQVPFTSRLVSLLAIAAILAATNDCHADEETPAESRAIRSVAKIKLIYDGDIGPDACDFSTISMLHEYHKRGMIDLLGVIGETPDPYLASTFSIYNQLHGNDIPIAAYDSESSEVEFTKEVIDGYYKAVGRDCRADPNKTVYEKYGNDKTQRSGDVMGTVTLYRKLLSEADDNSVVIYTAGQLYNFPPLLASKGDQYSPLSGEELLKAKLKEFVVMGGCFPVSNVVSWYVKNTDGAEWNWWAFGSKNTTANTVNAIVNFGKPVTYIGSEVGPRVKVGKHVVKRLGRDHPTSEGFHLFTPITEVVEGSDPIETKLLRNNSAYDELALFYAVEGGIGEYFERVPGRVQINESGANKWVETKPEESNESYLRLLPGAPLKLKKIITNRIIGKF